MHLDGSHLIRGPRQAVWDALHDPAVLVATIPGCIELREEGPDDYVARVEAGIASLTGIYDGHVSLTQQVPPREYVLSASGQGGPGTVDTTVTIRLSEAEGGTIVEYEAEAVIGGAVAGVGQRVIAGVAKRSAAQFFTAVDAHLMGVGLAPVPEAVDSGAAPAELDSSSGGQTVYRPPTPPARTGAPVRDLLLATAVGGSIALAGVAIGVVVGSRRRR